MSIHSISLTKSASTDEFIASTEEISVALKEASTQNVIVGVKKENGLTSIEIRGRHMSDKLYDQPAERKCQLEKALFAFAAENREFIYELPAHKLQILTQLPGMEKAASISKITSELFEQHKNSLSEVGAKQMVIEEQKNKMMHHGALLSEKKIKELEVNTQNQLNECIALVPKPAPLLQQTPSPTRAAAILRSMRMNSKTADMTLKGSGGDAKAHRAVLQNIPFFSNPTLKEMREKAVEIDLSQIASVQTLNVFLEHQYQVSLPEDLDIDQLLDVYHLAQYLDCQKSMSVYLDLIMNKIDAKNSSDILPELFNLFILDPTSITEKHLEKFMQLLKDSSKIVQTEFVSRMNNLPQFDNRAKILKDFCKKLKS